MRVVGADPSSSSSGFSYVVDDVLKAKAVWTPRKKATRAAALVEYEDSFGAWLDGLGHRPDLAVVEELAVARGHKTVRALSHFEAATYMALERRKIPIMTVKAGKARNIVLGISVTSSKEDAFTAVRMQYPDIRWSQKDRGGLDEADSFVLAKAGPEVMREQ